MLGLHKISSFQAAFIGAIIGLLNTFSVVSFLNHPTLPFSRLESAQNALAIPGLATGWYFGTVLAKNNGLITDTIASILVFSVNTIFFAAAFFLLYKILTRWNKKTDER